MSDEAISQAPIRNEEIRYSNEDAGLTSEIDPSRPGRVETAELVAGAAVRRCPPRDDGDFDPETTFRRRSLSESRHDAASRAPPSDIS